MTKLNKDIALVVLSGGQDSTTCLWWAKQQYREVHALTFDYDQRHRAELTAAHNIGKLAGVKSHEFLKLGPVLAGTSPLTNKNKQLEQYADAQSLPGGLEKTFVPGRNILFMSLAANRAYVLGASHIITGICQEDNGGYPDCTENFRHFMELGICSALDADVSIITPLMFKSKAETVRMAYDMDDNRKCWMSLAFSHTSYDGAYPPVGHDHATLLRAKGFEQGGLPDPLILRAVQEGLMRLPDTTNYTGAYIDYYDADLIREFKQTISYEEKAV